MKDSELEDTPLGELIKLLDIEKIEENLYRGFHPKGRKHRLFGGQIIAQALVAATRTVPGERLVHSLHAYFLRPGDPNVPALFEVDRIRDGKSFTTRRIKVIQSGQAIFNMDASFQRPEQGLEHAFPMPELSPPDDAALPAEILTGPFISFREDHKRMQDETPQEPRQQIWFKTNGPVPADPILHTALLAYESDSALLSTSRLPHRGSFAREKMQMASLDHTLWFHRPVNIDEWLVYCLDSPSAAGARGFNRGTIYSADGQLVASCHQEGLMRIWS
ncbi:MAG: acyl-CoA thioesterase II [Pseudomonadales bacterium]